MNAGLENTDHPSILYYDGDYPSKKYNLYADNYDETVVAQGLAYDVDYYLNLIPKYGQSVLELCCGTGRVTLPIAEAGYSITAVDFTKQLLKKLEMKVKAYCPELDNRIQTVEQDVTTLSLTKNDFDVIICPFNSLLCIPDFNLQLDTLINASKHVRKGGLLSLDLINPFIVDQLGSAIPKPFFTRRNPDTGNYYTRFAAMGKMDSHQKQMLYGWYDEIDENNFVKRVNYKMYWRPIYPYELKLMLEKAGFTVAAIYGGHKNESYTIDSHKMIVEAIKK